MKKSIFVKDVEIGAAAPVSIQSMCNKDPHDLKALLRQIDQLEEAGCQIVRLAVPTLESAEVLGQVVKSTKLPIVADIHFDYRLALAAIENGAHKIRINPGNIGGKDKLAAVVKACKERNLPIRVGVNSGSLEKDILEKEGGVTAEGLCQSAMRNVKLIEELDYDQLVISLKSSSVKMNYESYRLVDKQCSYPLHIGVTEAGTLQMGTLKSAVGLGALLLEGIGNTMRVSLTADPVEEVILSKQLLEIAGLRQSIYQVVSCPTCGRTQVALQHLAEEVEGRLKNLNIKNPIKVAVMGCVVNGPGEAREADYGIAGGKAKAAIFKKGKVVMTVPEGEAVERLMAVIEDNEKLNI